MPWHSSWRWSTTLRISGLYTLGAKALRRSHGGVGVGRRHRPAERSEAVSAPSMSVLAAHWAALVGVRPVRRAPGRCENALRRSSGPFERSTRCMLQRTASTPPCAVCVARRATGDHRRRPHRPNLSGVAMEAISIPVRWPISLMETTRGDGLLVAYLGTPAGGRNG